MLKNVQKSFPNNDFVPKSIKSYDELKNELNIDGLMQYIKSNIRKIADALDIKHLELQIQKTILGNDVFIVHGHDETAKEKVARLIEKLELKPIILHEQPNAGKTIIEKFENHSSKIGFAIILLTPDDIFDIKGEGNNNKEKRARQNVILELGFFIGAIGRERTCVLYKEGVTIPSDYEGVLYIPMDKNDAWKMFLAREIKQVGIPVDLNKILS